MKEQKVSCVRISHICTMDEDFELPLFYKGEEIVLPARFLRTGYSYKLQVEVNEQLITFEPDEERAWRALIDPEEINKYKIDHTFLQAIIEVLDEVFK